MRIDDWPTPLPSRRGFLTSAASGLGTLALSSLLAQEASGNPLSPRPPHFPARARACIFLFLAGGTSQLDLFDPKPTLKKYEGQRLPDSFTRGVRFAFISPRATVRPSRHRFRQHGQSGMAISDLLPNLARHADDLVLIRSMHTEVFNHLPGHLFMNTGHERFGRPSVGSWVLYGLGSPSQDLPGYVVLTSHSLVRGGGGNWSNGFLPSAYQGVRFRSKGEAIPDLSTPGGITSEAQRATLDTVSQLNRLRLERMGDPEIAGRIAAYELAFRMQSAAPELMDLTRESKRTLDAYGVDRAGLQPVVASADNKPRPVSQTFSINCLLARRMVEAGVRFVTIFHGDWDHHHGLEKGLRINCEGVDRPIAALLQDLKERGLLDTTLVVCGTEFGRTCLGQGKDGRDHHPLAFSMWLAGGGVKGGTVVGQTDEFGWKPAENPVHVHDLHATLLHLFGLDHERLTYRFQGRDFRLTDVAGRVVKEVLG
jgi:hypothetical protein